MKNSEVPEGFKMTELGPLPEEWSVVRLGDRGHFTILPSGVEKFEGTKKYLSTSSIELNRIVQPDCEIPFEQRPSRANMQPLINSVWFAKMKNTVKVYSFTQRNTMEAQEYILSTGFSGIACNSVSVEPMFFEKVLLSDWFNRLKDSVSHGSTQQAINNQDIEEFKIPLPPLPEQHAIARILSTVQRAQEATERVIAAAREVKKSLMRKLFTAGLEVEAPRKETEIGVIPAHWRILKLKDACQLIVDCPHSTPKFLQQGVLVVRNFNIRGGAFSLHEKYFVSEEEYAERVKRCVPIEGDILFSREAPIGEACLIPQDLKLCLGQRMMLIRINPAILDNKFQVYSFYSDLVRSRLLDKGMGVTAHHINVADVREFEVPLPPLPEQREIARILSIVDYKIEAEENRKRALEALFKTLLNNLMTGKIRVNKLEIPT